jgi:hypothetical protein
MVAFKSVYAKEHFTLALKGVQSSSPIKSLTQRPEWAINSDQAFEIPDLGISIAFGMLSIAELGKESVGLVPCIGIKRVGDSGDPIIVSFPNGRVDPTLFSPSTPLIILENPMQKEKL